MGGRFERNWKMSFEGHAAPSPRKRFARWRFGDFSMGQTLADVLTLGGHPFGVSVSQGRKGKKVKRCHGSPEAACGGYSSARKPAAAIAKASAKEAADESTG